MTPRRKLIEVALPLDLINRAAINEKSVRHGHPSTLHLWWSRKPLATCRAVLFASLVDDPGSHPELFPGEEAQAKERKRLFEIIGRLVDWKNVNDETVLEEARAEIRKYAGENPPPVLDPFAGGGSIPLEAQRLGLEAYASDLNPVAVLINKALIEIPPKFAGRAPVNPEARASLLKQEWKGAHGLAADIRYYSKWMRDEAERRIGHLYPKVTLPQEQGGMVNVIAWLWARTVTCPNPACGAQMPLTNKWWLSKKKGKEAWVEPRVEPGTPPRVRFFVHTGQNGVRSGTVNRNGAECVVCGTPVPFDYISAEGRAGRIGAQLMAIVAEGSKGRVYLSPNEEHTQIVRQTIPVDAPDSDLPEQALGFRIQRYGMKKYRDLFTARQIVALTTFSDLALEAWKQVLDDIYLQGEIAGNREINDATAYADAIATYLSLAVDRLADRNSSICSWDVTRDSTRNTFARQAISMVWDYAEANPFSNSTGNFLGAVDGIIDALINLPYDASGEAQQRDAVASIDGVERPLISTDPPYYDNIGYADLSDFFYVWLRRSLKDTYPDLFGTMLVPKKQELIAATYRHHDSKHEAQHFFESGLRKSFERMREKQHPNYPLSVYYAFKQAETETENDDDIEEDEHSGGKAEGNGKNGKVIASTGWETMLEGLVKSGFTITGTWPMRTELANRARGHDSNALAASIVLVCRPRPQDAPIATRREFLNALREELPAALRDLQHSSIAPVDLAQASIGPGMQIYSRYRQVVEADGTPLSVRTALQMINKALDGALAEQESEYDPRTRWAVAWFEQYAMELGLFGDAETLSKAKNTSVHALTEAGILEAKAGKVRLLTREELAQRPWQPHDTAHLTIWEITQRLIFALQSKGAEEAAREMRDCGERAAIARDLAYRLYAICERKGWAREAQAYNGLVMSWLDIGTQAERLPGEIVQSQMF